MTTSLRPATALPRQPHQPRLPGLRPLAAACLLAVLAGCAQQTAQTNAMTAQTTAHQASADALAFDPGRYQTQTITADGKSIKVRAYEGIVYVARPVDAAQQVMNIYVPEAYFHGGSVDGFTAQTAPIFLPNQIGGYMPAKPGTALASAQPRGNAPANGAPNGGANGAPNEAANDGAGQRPGAPGNAAANMPAGGPPTGRGGPGARPNTIAQALLRGYVVASPGARGRTSPTGKAPAAIVDLKAAVRWLRHHDARLPGDAEKIISNGTSAGGALSALLGASGNHADYAAELRALGAADARDDIFAVSAYCPITNLENADAAYEWQFAGVNDYKKISMRMLDYNVQRTETPGTLDAAQQATSAALAPRFVPYLNSLALRSPQGQALVLDAAGNGTFKDYVAAQVVASAQRALDAGQDLSSFKWLRVQGKKVTGIDFAAYVRGIGRMKTPPAFDALDLSSGENQLFGSAQADKRHFTAFSAQNSRAGAAAASDVADAATVQRMNAMHYIANAGSTTARHWRVRHGTADRDTSLAVPAMLALRLQNTGHEVDFALPWNRPHSGDYDLDELFAWMRQISTQR